MQHLQSTHKDKMIDIIKPDGDEKKFIKIAEKLGLTGLVFLYDKPKDLKTLRATTKLKLFSANAKGKCDLIVAEGRDNERHLLEKTGVDVVYGLERDDGRDHTHYRYSGMNQVLAKIAHDKDKIICFDIGKVISASGVKRVKLLGRMMQNIMLCKKYKVKMAVASFAKTPFQMRDSDSIMALLKVIGMESGDAKKTLNTISTKLK